MNKIYFLLNLIIVIVSCQPESNREKEKALMDSLFKDASKSISASEDSVKKYILPPSDSTLFDSDFDIHLKSATRVYFDKNQVEWSTEEKNEFRIVHKKKQNKLIVYKNNLEFKVYHNPKIYTTNVKNGIEPTQKDITMIYVGEKKILSNNFLIGVGYAPNGFKNYSEHYLLEPIHFESVLKEILERRPK